MPGFDAAIRWARFDRRTTLARRDDGDLPFARDGTGAGPALLLDTCVYIDQLKGSTPSFLDGLIERRRVNHSSVAVQELMRMVGVLDPDDPRTATVTVAISRLIRAMRPYRAVVPDLETLGRAALLAGVLCRIQGYAAQNRLRALQDCVLFLQAQRLGFTVLTRNVADFDYLLQLLPNARALFYRRG